MMLSGSESGNQLMHLHTWEQPFLDFILASAGLKLHQHQMDSFYTLVYSACERFGYHHPLAYLNSLKSSPQWSPEMEYLISGTTVGETYFFRDLTQISFIRDHWLPRIIEQRRNSGERRLRVWSAGSATGEELYTMAIILRELLQDIDYWDIQLIGTDINNSSIVKATEGIYSQWSLRSIDEQIREKYFTTMGDGFVLNSSIRKMANFKHFNLNNDQLPFDIRGSHNIDLILCRNVFIYFSYPVIRHVMEKFSEALVLGGTLMLAPTDIPDVTQNYPGLEYAQHDGVFFYQRNDNQLVNTTLETANQPSFFAKFDTGVKVDKTVTFKPEKPVFSSPVASDLTQQISIDDIEQKFLAGQVQEALLQIDKAINYGVGNAKLFRLKIQALTSLGDIEQSMELCLTCLERYSLDPELWYLHALLLCDTGDAKSAEVSLKKALYLDWDFPEVHTRLGLLSAQKGYREIALRHFRNARKLLSSGDAGKQLRDGSGMNYQELNELLAQDMKILAGILKV